MRKDYDIVGSYNNQPVSSIDAERTVNLYEYIDPKGKKPKVLLPTQGLLAQALDFVAATDGHRASFVYKNVGYVVIGQNIYSITTDLVVTRLNSALQILPTDSGYVGIDANTFQIIFVDGQVGYIYDTLRSVFEQITDTNFPARPIDVCSLDGFFVVANGETNNFQLSEFNQGLLWGTSDDVSFTANAATDLITVASTANFATGTTVTFTAGGGLPAPLVAATDYYVIQVSSTTFKVATTYADAIAGTAIDITTAGTPPNTVSNTGELQLGSITAHPGNIVACRTLHRRLFLFSTNYIEVWENRGVGSNLPFRRNNSLLIEVGTPAIGSIATGFDRMYFLSQDEDGLGSIMEVAGSQARPVSNRALDVQLADYASDATKGVSDARSFLVKIDGLIFYRLNFTRADHTFVYNVSMSNAEEQRWHEEQDLRGGRHWANTHLYLNGKNYYGDYRFDTLYEVNQLYNTNSGEAIQRIRIGKAFVPEAYERIRIDRFQLDLVQGDADLQGFVTEGIDILTEDLVPILTEDEDNLIIEDDYRRQSNFAPDVFLSISKDGGRTYGYQLRSQMGQLGERTFRTIWRKLGTIPRGQAFVPKIQFFNDAQFIVLGAAWAFEILPE